MLWAYLCRVYGTHFVQDLYCGIDPGRNNIGISVVKCKGEVVYAANLGTNLEH